MIKGEIKEKILNKADSSRIIKRTLSPQIPSSGRSVNFVFKYSTIQGKSAWELNVEVVPEPVAKTSPRKFHVNGRRITWLKAGINKENNLKKVQFVMHQAVIPLLLGAIVRGNWRNGKVKGTLDSWDIRQTWEKICRVKLSVWIRVKKKHWSNPIRFSQLCKEIYLCSSFDTYYQ